MGGGNKKRDRGVNLVLREQEYLILRLWDIDVRKRSRRCVEEIKKTLNGVMQVLHFQNELLDDSKGVQHAHML